MQTLAHNRLNAAVHSLTFKRMLQIPLSFDLKARDEGPEKT